MVNSTRSQTQQQKAGGGYSIANEQFNEDLILHCWRLVREQVRRLIEFNRSQGVPNPDAYVGYIYADGTPEPMSVKQKIRCLNITRHKKSGTWITVDSLVEKTVKWLEDRKKILPTPEEQRQIDKILGETSTEDDDIGILESEEGQGLG